MSDVNHALALADLPAILEASDADPAGWDDAASDAAIAAALGALGAHLDLGLVAETDHTAIAALLRAAAWRIGRAAAPPPPPPTPSPRPVPMVERRVAPHDPGEF